MLGIWYTYHRTISALISCRTTASDVDLGNARFGTQSNLVNITRIVIIREQLSAFKKMSDPYSGHNGHSY